MMLGMVQAPGAHIFWGQQEIENDDATTEHISQTTPWGIKGSKIDHICTDRFSRAGEMTLFFSPQEHEDICEGS